MQGGRTHRTSDALQGSKLLLRESKVMYGDSISPALERNLKFLVLNRAPALRMTGLAFLRDLERDPKERRRIW